MNSIVDEEIHSTPVRRLTKKFISQQFLEKFSNFFSITHVRSCYVPTSARVKKLAGDFAEQLLEEACACHQFLIDN